jgi:hypothetical protein
VAHHTRFLDPKDILNLETIIKLQVDDVCTGEANMLYLSRASLWHIIPVDGLQCLSGPCDKGKISQVNDCSACGANVLFLVACQHVALHTCLWYQCLFQPGDNLEGTVVECFRHCVPNWGTKGLADSGDMDSCEAKVSQRLWSKRAVSNCVTMCGASGPFRVLEASRNLADCQVGQVDQWQRW